MSVGWCAFCKQPMDALHLADCVQHGGHEERVGGDCRQPPGRVIKPDPEIEALKAERDQLATRQREIRAAIVQLECSREQVPERYKPQHLTLCTRCKILAILDAPTQAQARS